MGWFLPLILAIVFNVIHFLLTPKPKKAQPPEVKDLEDPTADPSRKIPVVFGTVKIKGLNVVAFHDKNRRTFLVNA